MPLCETMLRDVPSERIAGRDVADAAVRAQLLCRLDSRDRGRRAARGAQRRRAPMRSGLPARVACPSRPRRIAARAATAASGPWPSPSTTNSACRPCQDRIAQSSPDTVSPDFGALSAPCGNVPGARGGTADGQASKRATTPLPAWVIDLELRGQALERARGRSRDCRRSNARRAATRRRSRFPGPRSIAMHLDPRRAVHLRAVAAAILPPSRRASRCSSPSSVSDDRELPGTPSLRTRASRASTSAARRASATPLGSVDGDDERMPASFPSRDRHARALAGRESMANSFDSRLAPPSPRPRPPPVV